MGMDEINNVKNPIHIIILLKLLLRDGLLQQRNGKNFIQAVDKNDVKAFGDSEQPKTSSS